MTPRQETLVDEALQQEQDMFGTGQIKHLSMKLGKFLNDFEDN